MEMTGNEMASALSNTKVYRGGESLRGGERQEIMNDRKGTEIARLSLSYSHSAVCDLQSEDVGGSQSFQLVHLDSDVLSFDHALHSDPAFVLKWRDGGCSSARRDLQQVRKLVSWGIIVTQDIFLCSQKSFESGLDHIE